MTTYKMKHTKLHYIGNPKVGSYKLTAVNSMTNDGNTAYVLKSCGSSSDEVLYPMVIYKITNFSGGGKSVITKITVTKGGKTSYSARHANSITYAKRPNNDKSGFLFIATKNHSDKPVLLKVTVKGAISKEYYYIRNGVKSTFSCINYVGVDANNRYRFIVGRGKNNGRYCYDFATIISGNLVSDNMNFKGTVIDGWTANDIYWTDNKLYHVFFKLDTSGNIKYNRILQYSTKIIQNDCIQEPSDIYNDNAKSAETKYEIEGIVLYKSVFYGVANRNSTTADDNKDAVLKITKKT